MKHLIPRWISLVLCIALLFTALPAAATPTDETYRERVFQRYDASFEGSSYYENLLNSGSFLYEQWAANQEALPAAAQALTKPAEILLNRELDTEAYAEYLVRLMTMLECGFTDTIASQAAYTATLSGWDAAKGVSTMVGKLLPKGKILSRISKALDGFSNSYDLYTLMEEAVVDEQQLALLSVSSALYQEKCMVLESIIDHTDDEMLKEAAESLLAGYDAQFACLLGDYRKDAAKLTIEIGSMVTGADLFNDIVPATAGILTDKLTALAANSHPVVKAGTKFLTGALGKIAGLVGPLYVGVVVGSEFSKLLFGDQMECYREMQAQAAISDALCKALIETKYLCAGAEGDARYEHTRKYVAVGEALVYSRLRGDYCNILSRYSYGDIKPLLEQVSAEGPDGARLDALSLNLNAFYSGSVTATQAERVEELLQALEYYYWLEQNMTGCYWQLAGIFPENQPQVIVTTTLQLQQGHRFYSAFYMPHIEIVGNAEATARINNDPVLLQMLLEERQKQASYGAFTTERDMYAYHHFSLSDATCVGPALSLTFCSFGYAEGAASFGTDFQTLLFDIKTGKPLHIADMLDPEREDARSNLIRRFAHAIEEQVGYVWTTFDEAATALVDGTLYWNTADMSHVPKLNKEELVLQFSTGDIAPVMLGSPRVAIPLKNLANELDDRFIPKEQHYSGKLFFHLPGAGSVPGGLKRIHGAESLEAVYTVGDVLDIRITESRFPENWHEAHGEVFDGIVFYANYLTNEMVWVPENSGGSFVLEYNGKQEMHLAERSE